MQPSSTVTAAGSSYPRVAHLVSYSEEFAIVWGSEPPAFSIGYEREKIAPNDSGFTVLFSDAPDPEDVDDSVAHPDIGLVHLHHLLEDDPGLARGLDIAFEYGVADLDDDGEWVVGDLSRIQRELG